MNFSSSVTNKKSYFNTSFGKSTLAIFRQKLVFWGLKLESDEKFNNIFDTYEQKNNEILIVCTI